MDKLFIEADPEMFRGMVGGIFSARRGNLPQTLL